MFRKNKRTGLIVLGLILGILAMIILLYTGGKWFENKFRQEESRGDPAMRYAGDHILEYKGRTYRENNRLTTILLMGVDSQGSVKTSPYRKGGQADFLRLVVLDPDNKTVSQIQIDRDTMTPIKILGVLGNESGIRTAQLCLSHGYGDGKEKSCELTVEAVQGFLCGISIDHYVSMNMDGISVLNDMLGGVTVTLEDDFTALDPAMSKGTTLTLTGDQAEIYVRNRNSAWIGTNEARMKRQELYIDGITEILLSKMAGNKQYIEQLYDGLSGYLVTDMGQGELINEVWAAQSYHRLPVQAIEGSHRVGTDGFMQFHADEDAVSALVRNLFFC